MGDTEKPRLLTTYNLGELGVVITKSPVHGQDGELATAQNAVPNPEGGRSGLRKRFGFKTLNTTLAAGPILSFMSAALEDPGLPNGSVSAYGRYLYTANGGDSWTYLDVVNSPASPATKAVDGARLAFLHALDSGNRAEVAQDDGSWLGVSGVSEAHDQGRVAYVIPHTLSVGAFLYFWLVGNDGVVKKFDGVNESAAFSFSSPVDSILDWGHDGTYIYALCATGTTQAVYKVKFSDWTIAKLGDDLSFTAKCLAVLDGKVYVGGARYTSPTQSTAVVASIAVAGTTWADEFEDGTYVDVEAQAASVRLTTSDGEGHIDENATITIGNYTYTARHATSVPDQVTAFRCLPGLLYLSQCINTPGPDVLGPSWNSADYGKNTPVNTQVRAIWDYANAGPLGVTFIDIVARVPGAAGNGINISVTGSYLSVSSPTLTGGVGGGNQLRGVAQVTDLIAGNGVLYACTASTEGAASIKKLEAAAWTVVRSLNAAYGYVGIWAKGDEALVFETPSAIVQHMSKGTELGSAVFFLVGTGEATNGIITMVALKSGELQKVTVP